MVKVCGPRTYLIKTGHLIRARDKLPNELRELGIPVPKLYEQFDLSTASFNQRRAAATSQFLTSSVEHVYTQSPVVLRVLRRSERTFVRLDL